MPDAIKESNSLIEPLKKKTWLYAKTFTTFFNRKKYPNFLSKLNIYYYGLIYFYIMVAFVKLLTLIVEKEPDFNNIMYIVDGGIILIATLAALTFTYASASDYPEKKDIMISGKYFVKSLLNFVGGIVFLIGFGDARNHPSNLLSSSGILLTFSAFTGLITLLSGMVMLFLSAFFLVRGVKNLSKSLENKNISQGL